MATEQTRPDRTTQGVAKIAGGDGRSTEPGREPAAGDPSPRRDGDITSLGRFLAEARLLHRDRFGELVARLSTKSGPPEVARIARELVRTGVLTAYQAAAIYQGKGRGLLIGPYLVLDKLGAGGMGMVFKAIHRDHRLVVALKLLPPSYSRRSRAIVDRFRREAEALAKLQHPNIVCSFEGVKDIDGVYFLVMEYVEGRDLRFLVEKVGVFPVDQAIDCLIQTARGLQSAHSLGIIHRDIKPANLMLDGRGTIRILDFGLARVILPDSWIDVENDETASWDMMGTIPYMSPEQADDSERADARSDIYSLGCTLYFLLAGRPPYTGRTWSEMFLAHRQSPIPSLRAARPSVPSHLEELFTRMMAKEPMNRPPTMASVIASIELAEERARPASSHSIPVRLPDGPHADPMFSLDDLEVELPAEIGPESEYYVGHRIRPPDGPWEFRTVVGYLLLTLVSIAAFIAILELFRS
jgi:eukaryotic-like serine/threonine-protein kinase